MNLDRTLGLALAAILEPEIEEEPHDENREEGGDRHKQRVERVDFNRDG
jgi:hypothetical protein